MSALHAIIYTLAQVPSRSTADGSNFMGMWGCGDVGMWGWMFKIQGLLLTLCA